MSIKAFMQYPSGVLTVDESLAVAAQRCAGDPTVCFVVKDDRRVVGVLTASDVRAAGPSTLPCLAAYEHRALTARLKVGDAVRHPAVVVPLDAAVGEVAEALRTTTTGAAAVVDGGDVVGVVTTDALLRALIERLERAWPPRLARILVAVSIGPSTRANREPGTSLDVGLDLARRHGAILTLVHVVWGVSRRIVEGLPAGIDADVQRWRLTDARAALARTVPRDGGITVRTEVRTGDIAPSLVEAADETRADLIVMGGRPGSALVRAVTRRAPCPVLVV